MPPRCRRGRRASRAARQRDHRRQQHHAIEPPVSGVSGVQQDRCAHGLAECKQRRRAVRENDLVDEALEINLVLGEIAHVTLARVAERPLRHALAAPIEGGDREAAGAQVAHGLEIFLDEFRAPLKQAHRTLAAARRRPARKTQRDPIGRLEGAGDDVVGHRIGGNGDEGHDLCGGLARTPYSRAAVRLNPSGGGRARRATGIAATLGKPP